MFRATTPSKNYPATCALLSLLIVISTAQIGRAQLKAGFVLKAWKTYTSASWRDSAYLFPSFEEARIESVHGKLLLGGRKANYNLYTERLEIIAENKDTVALDNYHTIRFIALGDHVMYNDKKRGYLEIILQDSVSLAARIYLKAYMQLTNGERFFNPDNRSTTSRYDRIYIRKTSYYLVDTDGNVFLPSPRSFENLFPEKKQLIKAYLQNQPVRFQFKDDLIRLLNFCRHPNASLSNIPRQ